MVLVKSGIVANIYVEREITIMSPDSNFVISGDQLVEDLSAANAFQNDPSDAEIKAVIAMASPLTFGLEQITVSVLLLIISLYVLSRPATKIQIQQVIQYLICPFQKYKHQIYDDDYDDDDDQDYQTNNLSSKKLLPESVKCHFRSQSVIVNTKPNLSSFASNNNNDFPIAPPSPLRKSKSTPTTSQLTNDSPYKPLSSTLPIPGNVASGLSTNGSDYVFEHDRENDLFKKHYYAHIITSDFKRLVLPPSCRLLNPNKLKELKSKRKSAGETGGGVDTDSQRHNIKQDNSTNISYWITQISFILKSMYKFILFDGPIAMVHFFSRVMDACRTRSYNKRKEHYKINHVDGYNNNTEDPKTGDYEREEEDDDEDDNGEDDDDDSTIGSIGSKKIPIHTSSDMVNGTSGVSPSLTISTSMLNEKPKSMLISPNFFSCRNHLPVEDEGCTSLGDSLSTTSIDMDDGSLLTPSNSLTEEKTGQICITNSQYAVEAALRDKSDLPQSDIDIANTSNVSKFSAQNPHTGKVGIEGIDDKQSSVANGILHDVTTSHKPISAYKIDSPKTKKAKARAASMINPSGSLGLKQKDKLEQWRKGAPTNASQHPLNPKNYSIGSGSLLSIPGLNDAGNDCRHVDIVVPSEEAHKHHTRDRTSTFELAYFDTANTLQSLKKILPDIPLPDKEGYIIGDSYLDDSSRDTPLLVFVNSRSGAQQGLMLKAQLKRLLNPIQVWDLADGGPEKILASFSVLTRLRILVCGGDGTVSWIISALEKMNLERWPPIAILPIGTGNDLARIHGWGPGYANESLLLILKQIQDAYVSLLDRWVMSFESPKKKKNTPIMKSLINYMSIGSDAGAALNVHDLRENNPRLFFSRAVNKIWYVLFGAEEGIKASYTDLPEQIKLEADGIEIPIPPDSQGLVILNIDSYTGGLPLWSTGLQADARPRIIRPRRYSDTDIDEGISNQNVLGTVSLDDFDLDSIIEDEKRSESPSEKLARLTACNKPSSSQDGKLDIISHRGNFHLGQIRVGLSYPQLLCQCSRLKLTLKKGQAVQIDGEPWYQEKGVLTIERKPEPAIMLHRAMEEGGGIECEVSRLLDWAAEKKIIERNVHHILMKEFSRRIESKNRERRIKSQGTVFSTMKRAIASSNGISSMY